MPFECKLDDTLLSLFGFWALWRNLRLPQKNFRGLFVNWRQRQISQEQSWCSHEGLFRNWPHAGRGLPQDLVNSEASVEVATRGGRQAAQHL